MPARIVASTFVASYAERRTVRRCLQQVILIAGLLSSEVVAQEWPQYLGGPGHSGASSSEALKPPFKLLWSYRLDGDASGDAGAGVIVGSGLVFANVMNSRSIVALDAETGAFRWEYSEAYPGYKDVPSYASGRLFLWERSKQPCVSALDAASGKLLWRHPLNDREFLTTYTRSGLAVDQDRVFLSEGGTPPTVQSLDAKTGETLWKTPVLDAGLYVTPPSVANGRVFVGVRSSYEQLKSRQGAVIALDARTGKQLWRRDSVPSVRPLFTDGADVACTLVESEKLVFQLLDAATGTTRWSIPRAGAQAPLAMIAPDVVIMKTFNGAFSVLERSTGRTLNGFSGSTRSGCCVPAVAGGFAFWGTGTTPPPAGGAADVESLSAFAWPESPREQGIVGNMHAIDLATGKSVWRFGAGNTICGDPALAYGRLYFTSRDGNVYCFAPAANGETITPEAKDRSPAVSADATAALIQGARPQADDASWPTAGGDLHRSGKSPDALRLPLSPAWEYPLGGRIVAAAVVHQGIAVVGSDAGDIAAIDVKTGGPKWKFPASAAVRCTPAVADGTVYCGSDSGLLHAFDLQTGKELWRFACGGPVRSSPAVVGGVLLFGADDHHIYALARDTGKKLWSFRMRCHAVRAPVVVNEGRVFVGQWNDWVSALDLLTGEEQWRSYVPVSIEAVAYYRDRLYVRSPYYIVELDPTSGRRLRLAQTSYGYGGLGFFDDFIVQSGLKGQYGDHGATKIDLSQSGRAIQSPSLEGVQWLQAKRFGLGASWASLATPLVLDKQVCLATNAGELVIADGDGRLLWSTALPGVGRSSPISANGMLFVGDDDGRLHAFREQPR